MSTLGEDVDLKRGGFIGDLPGAIDIDSYRREIERLRAEIRTLPRGLPEAGRFEEFIGDLIKLAFSTPLQTPRPR